MGLIDKTNTATLTLTLKNGAMIRLGGSKNWDKFRGSYCCLFIVDEFAFCENPEGFKTAIYPMLATPKPAGRVLFLSTPDGKNHFYDVYMMEHKDSKRWKSFHFTTLEGKLTTPEEVENLRSSFTPTKFRQEFYGEFINPTGLVYYQFGREKNVLHGKMFFPKKHHDIHWSWDFNVNPSCHTTLSYIGGDGKVLVFDEIAIGNTPDNLNEFIYKYKPKDFRKLYIYGDYSGNINTSGRTDYTVIFNTLKEKGYDVQIKVYGRNPIVRDRTENVNRLLEDALGNRMLYVLDACPILIRDLELVKRNNNSSIDKTFDSTLTHISDALGYQLWVTHPPRRITGKKAA
jgi:hypothetical protein